MKLFAVRRICAGHLPHERCTYVLYWLISEASRVASSEEEQTRHHVTRLLNFRQMLLFVLDTEKLEVAPKPACSLREIESRGLDLFLAP